jgi:hypothetical protein
VAVFFAKEPAGYTSRITIQPTKTNSSGVKISASGGSGASYTRTLAAPNGEQNVRFIALKKSAQTLTIGGDDAGRVRKADAPVDGEPPGPTRDVFIVDSSSIAGADGGSLTFVITVEEPGMGSLTYTITLVATGITSAQLLFKRDDRPAKMTYLVGEAFDRDSVSIEVRYSDNSWEIRTDYEVEGFDSSSPGIITVQFRIHGKLAYEGLETNDSFAMTILAPSESRLIFAYGGRLDPDVPQRSRYTVTEGRTLVIAPVLWRIPAGAVFQWTVSGGAATTQNREYLTFNPGSPVGTYDGTVTASFDEQIVSASTTVECVNAASSPGIDREFENAYFASGQFIEPNWGLSLGGYGGSFTHYMRRENGPGDDFHIKCSVLFE